MEKWRASYIKYSRINKINVDFDSDDIFKICNRHYLTYLKDSQTWTFPCTLNCYHSDTYDSDSDDNDEHTVNLGAWRCSYGSSISCTINKSIVYNLIGFITMNDLEEFVNIDFC